MGHDAEQINEGIAYLFEAVSKSPRPDGGSSAFPGAEGAPYPVAPLPTPANDSRARKSAAAHATSGKAAPSCATDGCDAQTWATFSNISLHGCYVEAQATYRSSAAPPPINQNAGFLPEVELSSNPQAFLGQTPLQP